MMKVFVDESPGKHWSRRFVAYLIDLLLMGLLMVFVFRAMERDWSVATDSLMPTTEFLIYTGVIFLIYSAVFEYVANTTVGKILTSLGTYSLDGYQGEMTFGQALLRNLSRLHPLLTLLDTVAGWIAGGDNRQKLLDRIARTIVMTVGEEEFEVQPVKRTYVPPPPPKEKTKEVIHLKEGDIVTKQCPNCGTPYQLVYKADGTLEVLGPWQGRCTWCNAYLGAEFTRL